MASRGRIRTVLAVLLLAATATTGCSGSGSGGSDRSPTHAGLPGHPAGPANPANPNPGPVPYPSSGAESRSGADRDGVASEVDPRESPQSTFAMDVDTASYGYASSLIRQGNRPAPAEVRPEEFVNAFRQDYPQPGGDGFSVSVDGSRLPATHRGQQAGDTRLMRIGLQTRDDSRAGRPDVALTFVIDVSGSMGEPGKLTMVKQALHTLVDTLRQNDSVAIVTFSDQARTVRAMTPVNHRDQLHGAIDELAIQGSTNLEAGLVMGYQVARQGFRPGATNRVVLLSDGLANQGDTQAAPILARVSEEASKQITLLGVGVGDDYGDTLMEQLADHGDGFVIYVSDLEAARKAFVDQLPATRSIRALDAKVQVTFDPRTVAGYRLIGYDDRALAASSFRNDHVDGGEVAAGHSVTALYTVRLRPGAGGQVAQAEIRWQDPTNRQAHEAGATVAVADLGNPFTEASPRLQVCYAAAYFAEALRQSPYGAEVRLADLARIASGAADRTHDAAVADLAELIRLASD